MVFFPLLGPSKASYSEINFDRDSDQRNSRNAGRFKSTNQRLASSGGFERWENRGALPL